MTKFKMKAVAMVLGFAFSAVAGAQGISRDEYSAGKERTSSEYKKAKAACDYLAHNAKDICVAEAAGWEKVARADLEASYRPSVKATYAARVARAEADYSVARQRCDDKSGNVKDVCITEAKAAATVAKADAKAQMTTRKANDTAAEKTADARADASATANEARRDAATDKRDAEYQVEKEKCDTYSGSAKDSCQSQAKARFGKS